MTPWIKRLHPDDRTSAERHLFETLASNATTYTAEYRIIRPSDGGIRWIRAVAEIERDAEGRATRLVGAHLDITERNLAEQALAESEVRFRSIANSAPVPIWVSNLEGRREFVNQAFVDFLGLRVNDALSVDMSVLLHPDDCEAYLAGRATGEASQQPFSLEGRFRRHDGAWRWMRAEFQTRRNASGEPDGFIAVAHDISESKAAAQKLTQMNEMLELRIEERSSQLAATEALIQTFFQHSSECHAVIVESVDGRFRYEEINPATLQLYNKSRSDVIGHPIEDVVGAAGAADITHHLRAALIAGVPQRYERTQAGSIVEAFATPVPTEPGSPRRVIVSARDVTERRHLEEQLRQAQKMEAVGQLTGGIAHDFNNLLTIVLGGLEAIGRQTANLAPSTAVTRMERSRDMAMQGVQRAAALTSRLLAFSRQQALAPQTIDANRLVAGLTDMLHRSLGEAVMLEVDLSEELWSTYADPNQLENALLNLAVNARDAMPEGGKLTIATRNIVLDTQLASTPADPITPGQYVMIAVTDTGSGMDQATKDRAFDPFFTTKDVGKGTGLGLSQVYGFTRQSAGHVRIESQPGKGTTVRLYLPRRLGSDERVDTADMGTAARALPGESILVVEDDETLRIHTLETLRELGYRVEEASTGVVAINRLRSGPAFNLVLTDIVMAGGINGREVAERAQKDNPGLKVLFMTGYSRNTVVKDGQIDAGIHVLAKPFSYHELARKVRSRLDAAD